MTASRRWAEVERCAVGQLSSEYLVGGALPGRVGVVEEHLDAERVLGVGPAGRLAALVPDEGAHETGGLAGERSGDRPGGLGRPAAVRQGHDQGVAADALDEGRGGAAVLSADDEVAFPAARLGPPGRGGWPLAQ